jgi:hypothetical protein
MYKKDEIAILDNSQGTRATLTGRRAFHQCPPPSPAPRLAPRVPAPQMSRLPRTGPGQSTEFP